MASPSELFFDGARTTVASSWAAVSAGTVQTWVVASASTFIDVNSNTATTGVSQFRVVDPADTQIPPEVILVTNVSGTTWTVTRGADNTTPTNHAAGFQIFAIATSYSLTNMVQSNEISTIGTSGALSDGTGLETLAQMAPGGCFTVVHDDTGGTGWHYPNLAGAAITVRPTTRSDLTMFAKGGAAASPPAFALSTANDMQFPTS